MPDPFAKTEAQAQAHDSLLLQEIHYLRAKMEEMDQRQSERHTMIIERLAVLEKDDRQDGHRRLAVRGALMAILGILASMFIWMRSADNEKLDGMQSDLSEARDLVLVTKTSVEAQFGHLSERIQEHERRLGNLEAVQRFGPP